MSKVERSSARGIGSAGDPPPPRLAALAGPLGGMEAGAVVALLSDPHPFAAHVLQEVCAAVVWRCRCLDGEQRRPGDRASFKRRLQALPPGAPPAARLALLAEALEHLLGAGP
ncbi:hypothetical protein HYH03_017501 [Edaphochlamys debaryana]|uniref:Uncharacterized protein n=1 Tax=Edaphochlamys debaryana TaxID=47281 RepID=A0A835XJW4_9CHLO|nr:hypothetical protein HYH03_017501 [Edaphochlamys debaryana]|eukprot:KAG2483621.1 hypothetical protein HYH03_017501 [Edaphochlamys debaryana]